MTDEEQIKDNECDEGLKDLLLLVGQERVNSFMEFLERADT